MQLARRGECAPMFANRESCAEDCPPYRLPSHAFEVSRYAVEDRHMKTRCFDHIDLRVTDMKAAKKFYRKFLPQLGFVHEKPGRYHAFYSAGGDKPSEFLGFTQDKKHKPNGTRIAFWADTREEVDQIAKLVRDAGGKNLEGPEICTSLLPSGYYAFFFEDPDGNKLEICCREKPVFVS
jgi:catechol 2,3-dioxygenase-like lactoylglutathione lyase family enzyme